MDNSSTGQYSSLIHQLVMTARSTVRDMDPQNDLTFLRVRSKKNEIMIAPEKDYFLIVIQNPSDWDGVHPPHFSLFFVTSNYPPSFFFFSSFPPWRRFQSESFQMFIPHVETKRKHLYLLWWSAAFRPIKNLNFLSSPVFWRLDDLKKITLTFLLFSLD